MASRGDRTADSGTGMNIEVLSSVLDPETRGVSTSGMAYPPVDGSLLITNGEKEDAEQSNSNFTSLTQAGAATLSMVWGSHKRTDRAAFKSATVFYVNHTLHIRTKLFNFTNGQTPTKGDLVFVGGNVRQLLSDGSPADTHLIPDVINIGGAADGWVIGHVARTMDSAPNDITNDGAENVGVEIMLYSEPRWVKVS